MFAEPRERFDLVGKKPAQGWLRRANSGKRVCERAEPLMGAHCVACRQRRNPGGLRRHGREQRHPEFPGELHRAHRITQASIDPPAVRVH